MSTEELKELAKKLNKVLKEMPHDPYGSDPRGVIMRIIIEDLCEVCYGPAPCCCSAMYDE